MAVKVGIITSFPQLVQCTSDIVATLGHLGPALSGHYIRLATISDLNIIEKCILYQEKWPLYPNGQINIS